MTDQPHMLPGNSTPWERAMSLATDVLPTLEPPAIEMRGVKIRNPPNSFLPFLHYEYGLGGVARYIADPRQAIMLGIEWERVRGTHAAVGMGLDWLGYAGDIEVFPTRRRRWNLFMLEMDRLRDAEEPDLANIEDVANLSTALRSRFWRGFKVYDVRALEYGWTKWGQTRWSAYSGARLAPDRAKWSFGRIYERDYTPSQADLEALGVWIAGGGETDLTWGAFSWDDADASWVDNAALVRRRLMASGVLDRPTWVCFRDADDDVIGYRRARVARGVVPAVGGVYSVGEVTVTPSTAPEVVYVEAMTDFGDGYGSEAATWSLVFDAEPLDATKPGLLWAEPDELSAGIEIMTTAAAVPFGRTVRERFRTLLRF